MLHYKTIAWSYIVAHHMHVDTNVLDLLFKVKLSENYGFRGIPLKRWNGVAQNVLTAF